MTLFEALKTAKSEEDVKEAYIKALGLKTPLKTSLKLKPKKSGSRQKINPAELNAMFTHFALHCYNNFQN